MTREIDESELGVTINDRLTIGSIMFADDTTLIANSVETCKKLLAITDKYGIDYEITYNGDKTDLIIISPHQNTEDISGLKLNGKQITKSESLKFLGSMISSNNTNTTHINSRIDKLNKGLFSLRHTGILSNYVTPTTKAFMYKAYLRSILMYGLDLCTLTTREEEYIQTCESNLIKYVLNLHYKNRHTALFIALDIMSFDEYIRIAKMRLFIRLCKLEITRQLINNTLKSIDNQRFGRNDLVKEIYEFVKEKLPDSSNINNLIVACENEIICKINRHKSIRNSDNLIDKIKEIIMIKSARERTENLRKIMQSFDSNLD